MTGYRRINVAVLFAAALAALFVLPVGAGADVFTYDMLAAPGFDNGSELFGTITIGGNTGDSFTLDSSLANVDSLDLEWSLGQFSTSWNFGDLATTGGTAVDFSGVLGDPVLFPDGGSVSDPLVLINNDSIVLELGFSAPDPVWAVGTISQGAFDVGAPWELVAPSAPLPTGFAMALIGMGAMLTVELARMRRMPRVRVGDGC